MVRILLRNVQGRINLYANYAMAWGPRAKGAPVVAGIIFHTSISLVTVTMFVRCFPKISTSSFPDLAGILHSDQKLSIALYYC